ncbi:hypothetical protein PTKIN_Ptkin01aG0294700 [Pterospermum kingtungense]
MQRPTDFISGADLVDLPLLGGKFTWSNNRERPTFCRLDRFLISTGFISKFPDVCQKVLPKSLSNHNPLLLEENKTDWGAKPFKFFTHWMDKEGFPKMLKERWEGIQSKRGTDVGFGFKLRELKYAIKEWVKNGDGALGIMDLLLKNRGLVNKWIWHFGEDYEALRKKLILEKYGGEVDALLPHMGAYKKFFPLWRKVTKPLIVSDEYLDTMLLQVW